MEQKGRGGQEMINFFIYALYQPKMYSISIFGFSLHWLMNPIKEARINLAGSG